MKHKINKNILLKYGEKIPIVITNKWGKSSIKEFTYTQYNWYEENDNGLYSFDIDMSYDWHESTFTCPQKYLSKINHWAKRIGTLDFCVCGEAGITVFINTFDNKFPTHQYLKSWFWKKYKKVFWAVQTNKYHNN